MTLRTLRCHTALSYDSETDGGQEITIDFMKDSEYRITYEGAGVYEIFYPTFPSEGGVDEEITIVLPKSRGQYRNPVFSDHFELVTYDLKGFSKTQQQREDDVLQKAKFILARNSLSRNDVYIEELPLWIEGNVEVQKFFMYPIGYKGRVAYATGSIVDSTLNFFDSSGDFRFSGVTLDATEISTGLAFALEEINE